MKKFLLVILIVFYWNTTRAQLGSSCSNPFLIYPASNCTNYVVSGSSGYYMGKRQCPDGSCSNYTMSGTTTIDGSCPGNDITQTVSWLAVYATTTSFTISNNRDNSTGGPSGNALDYAVFSGTCGSLTEITCQVINGMGGTYTVTGLTAGTTYYILVSRTGSSASTTGAACITSTVPYVPQGNECVSATSVNTNVTYTLNNAGASSTGPMCSLIVATENVVWAQWCAPANWPIGQSAYVNLNNQNCNSSGGLQLTVWNTGTSCPTVKTDPNVVCANSFSVQQDYYFEWTAVANTCYYISIDGYAGTACNYDLTVGSIITACGVIQTPSTNNASVCKGSTASLTVTGSTGNYNWYNAAIGGSLIYTGSNYTTPMLNSDTTFYVTAFLSNCESDRVPVNVTAINYPLAEAGAKDTLSCSIPNLSLNGAGSSTGVNISYNWSTANGNIVSGGTTLTPNINSPGTYVITVTNTLASCISRDTVIISIDTLKPTASIGNPNNLTCTVSSVTLDATGSSTGSIYNYNWSTSNGNILNGTNGLTPEVDKEGTYTLTITNSKNGCQTVASVNVQKPFSDPVVSIVTPPVITCSAPSVTLNASGSSSGGQYNYSWASSNGGNILSGQTTLLPTVDKAGTYTITILDNNSGCSSTGSITVLVDTIKPAVSITQPGVLNCTTQLLNLSGVAASGLSYSWTTIGGNIVSGTSSLNPIVSLPGSYSLTVTALNGCSQSASVNILQDITLPTISIKSDTSLCIGQSFTPLTTVSGGSVYLWSPSNGISNVNITEPIISSSSTTVYTLTITNPSNGCEASDSIKVSIHAVAINIHANPLSGAAPLNVDFTGNTIGGSINSWSFGDGSIAFGLNPKHEFTIEGKYTVVFTSSDTIGCIASDSLVIDVKGASFIAVPNVFTPNGDEKNDYFGVDALNIIEFEMSIFNRWGEELFNAFDAFSTWDGYNASGKPVPDGTYFYIIKAKGKDTKEFNLNGSFSLLR